MSTSGYTLMCWLCYFEAPKSIKNTQEWKYEQIKGIDFWECPVCRVGSWEDEEEEEGV